MGGVRRVVLLTLGWEELPKSVSVHGAPADERLREPVPGVEEALAGAGIDLADVHAVAVSHLHSDHAGGLKHFAGRVPVHVQEAELAYGLSGHPEPESHSIYRVDFDDPRIDWRRADGDVEIAPGVTAVLTAGHTPGHQSFVVDLEGGGGFVFAFDAADLTENIEHELPAGSVIGVDPAETVEPIRRLKHIAAERGYRLVPGHDPEVWPKLTAELAAQSRPG
jgi:N-acyl homoserine lactone hydrolase